MWVRACVVVLAGCGRLAFDPRDDARDANLSDAMRVPETGLVAAWKLDEATGTMAADSAGSNDGLLVGTPIWQPTGGQIGGALRFSWPQDDRIEADHPALYITASLSVSAWVYFDTLSGSVGANFRQNIAGVGTDSPGYFSFGLSQNHHCGPELFGFRVSTDGVGGLPGPERCGTTQITSGRWYHVVGVYDATVQALDVYVDGALDSGPLCPTATCGSTTIPTAISGHRSTFTLGSDVNAQYCPTGLIDEVHIYDRALSGADVSNLYATGSTTGS